MIKDITISNFMGHTSLKQGNVPGINVIIGKNDTGKTGLLKLLYSIVKTLEVYSFKKKSDDVSFKKELADKLFNTFMPRKNGLGDLVQKNADGKLEVDVTIQIPAFRYKQPINFSFGERAESTLTHCIEHVEPIPDNSLNALFIPAKEVLTAFSDIRAMRENFYGKGFDDTYLDLIKALSLETTRGRVAASLNTVNEALEDLFEGGIEQTGLPEQPFLFKKGNQQFSMQMTAEGIKKIGILTTLIRNRQLGKGTVLFMDEPETALHPNAIRQLVAMLVEMSKAGVQIFMASHSYFILKQLAICAKRDQIDALCWSLHRNDKTVVSDFHNLKDGTLPENSIVRESLEMYNEDLKIQLGL